MSFDLNTVKNAISTLFDPNSTQQNQANKYLEDFQISVEAWDLCFHLLRINSQEPFTIQLWTFSAQTLHNKLLRDFNQLDSVGQNHLKDNLLSLLHLHPNSPPVVTRHLCFATCLLCLQLTTWENSVVEVINWLESAGANRLVLEFLTGLPEEITRSRGCSLSDEEFRSQCDKVLTQNSQFCLTLLTNYFNNYATQVPTLPSLIFKAIQSWLKSGDILLDDLFQTPFPKLSFQALQSPDMFDEAVEIICDIIYETREYHNFTQYIHELVTLLNSLLVNIKENADNFDGDNWRGLSRIFVEAGETWLNLILIQTAEFFNIVEGIYLCFKNAELEWIGMSFSFWIKFARDLEQVPNHPFAPIFKNLVESIINHLQFPDDEHEFTAQERDDFKDFRHEIGDILKDVCILLGPDATLNIPYTIINTRMQQGNLDSDPSAWKALEAPLFSLRCIGSQIPPDHSSVLPIILQLFPRLPNNPDLQYTCTLVIARYTQWTAHHPELIQFQLDYIINGFGNPTVAPASALALKFLCQDCSDALGQYFGRILEVYEKATSLLNKKEILDISEGVAYMVNSLQPQERYTALVKLIDPISKKLTPEHFSTLETLAFDIKRINLFFDITAPEADTDIPHPSAQIISTIAPSMELILEKLGDNYHVAEALGRFFVLLIRDYKQYTKEYIPTLLPRISVAFAKSSQPVYLWISERVITYHSEFSPSHCLNLIDSISMSLFQKLEAANFDPNHLPDLMEEYSYIVNAALSKLSQPFLRSHIASNVYRLLFLTPKLKEYHSFQSCLSSWRVFSRMLCVSEPPLSASELNPYFQVIDQAGQASLEDLIDGMIFDYSDESLHDALFVTIYLSELNPELHLNQMAKIIETLKGPNFLQSDRISFLQHYSEKIQNRNWREARSILQKFLEQFHKRNFARNNNRN